ncbi:MAG TPA: GxxExxY protein [Candidatus Magasanikbacteria bacterium]|nr:GxxExxY protein [Candidatus Magasanikbacteria bacterium]
MNNTGEKLIYPDLSYKINGILFATHNELGPYAREKQIGDVIEKLLKEQEIPYLRECQIGNSGNVLDFIIDNKIILELKSKRFIIRADYEQTQRYLQATQLKLAILVNFRTQYLKPIRIVKIDTQFKEKFIKKY